MAGRRTTTRRAESGAAPPPFCPNAGGLLPGTTASSDGGLRLNSSRPTRAGRRAAAPRERSRGARGSPAPGAPCTPRALRRSGRSRRSSLLARSPPPPPPPPERPPHPLLPPPPRPPRRPGLGSQRRAAASALCPAAARTLAPAPREHTQARPGGRRDPRAPSSPKIFTAPLPPWCLEPGQLTDPSSDLGSGRSTPGRVLRPQSYLPSFYYPFSPTPIQPNFSYGAAPPFSGPALLAASRAVRLESGALIGRFCGPATVPTEGAPGGGRPGRYCRRELETASLERTEGPRARPGNELGRCRDRGCLRQKDSDRKDGVAGSG